MEQSTGYAGEGFEGNRRLEVKTQPGLQDLTCMACGSKWCALRAALYRALPPKLAEAPEAWLCRGTCSVLPTRAARTSITLWCRQRGGLATPKVE